MSRKDGVDERTRGLTSSAAAAVAALAIAGMLAPAPASATGSWGLNGTYIATSNGEWAKSA